MKLRAAISIALSAGYFRVKTADHQTAPVVSLRALRDKIDSGPPPEQQKPDTNNWRVHAKCKGMTRTFFSENPIDHVAAKSYCNVCPIQKPCLADAILTREEFGVWGGKTARERKKLLRYIPVQAVKDLSHSSSAGAVHAGNANL